MPKDSRRRITPAPSGTQHGTDHAVRVHHTRSDRLPSQNCLGASLSMRSPGTRSRDMARCTRNRPAHKSKAAGTTWGSYMKDPSLVHSAQTPCRRQTPPPQPELERAVWTCGLALLFSSLVTLSGRSRTLAAPPFCLSIFKRFRTCQGKNAQDSAWRDPTMGDHGLFDPLTISKGDALGCV